MAQEPRVVQPLENFDAAAARDMVPITFWRWTPEQKKNAAAYSELKLVSDAGSKGQTLKVTLKQPLPDGMDFYPLWMLGLEYLPPETEAIRLRVKVLSGQFQINAGSPTAYFATSDVYTKPISITPGDWRTIEISLIHDLQRNYRRPIFSQQSPVIYYTRWIQETMRLQIGASSQGELLVDDIELVTRGHGRPFATFSHGDIRPLGEVDPATRFTFATDDREFALSHEPGNKAVRKPVILGAGTDPRTLWTARQRGTEEMSYFGVKARAPKGANALRITLKMEHESALDLLVADIFALVGERAEFPWDKTTAATSATEAIAPGEFKPFDYCLSPSRTRDVSWGLYHARRAVKKGEWTEMVIPFADFVCAYGSGTLQPRQLQQQPLTAEEVVAVAMLSPWRQRRAETHFSIGKIEFVSLPQEFAEARSYVQVPDISKIRLEKKPGPYGGAASQVHAP
ncbi:hypothetical protein DES53_104160 [Roseimicrobium gellanilyticum]|uniref:Uncharacterized protein n=2 Tax=Roseimicrobium gellanilyticum TaxID=748857 RepID=A0A366HP99_9BACT|nr:hypothetical protein DES53_104160 [Roseimicrobium gellanilyticum]